MVEQNIQMVSSGLQFIDRFWGGFYKGASYLVIGAKNSGRSLLGLQFAQEAINRGEVCLFFTSMSPSELMAYADSIGFDMDYYMNKNQLILVRVAHPFETGDNLNTDQFLIEYLTDIVSIVNQYNPSRIIFDEITAYVSFDNLDLLETAFANALENIESKDITSVYIISEPVTFESQIIVGSISRLVTATIMLSPTGGSEYQEDNNSGIIKLIPNMGHTNSEYSGGYIIKYGEGIVVPQEDKSADETERETAEINKPIRKTASDVYISLSNISVNSDDYLYSNIYSYNDFLLIVNNQIALFNSAGQKFHLISFKLNKEAERNNILTINQLENSVRLSTEKRDKICVIDKYVLVLVTKSDIKRVNGIISKLQHNLPGSDREYIRRALRYISVLCKEINETTENSEFLLRSILEAKESGDDNNRIDN